MARSLRLALVFAAAAALSGQARGGAGFSPFAKDMLAAHNAVRARLKLRPLAWSDRLADFARDWAETLANQHEFFHRSRNPYGENLFEITGAAATPEKVVAAWASESASYDRKSNTCYGVCGHYTQIVWRDTHSVGCAMARSLDRQVWVCNYDPPGNVVGQRPY